MFAGEYQLKAEDIELCTDRTAIPVKVSNTGDRPVQVGSHYHFAEANRALSFDRELAYGHRLSDCRWHVNPIRTRSNPRSGADSVRWLTSSLRFPWRRDGLTR